MERGQTAVIRTFGRINRISYRHRDVVSGLFPRAPGLGSAAATQLLTLSLGLSLAALAAGS